MRMHIDFKVHREKSNFRHVGKLFAIEAKDLARGYKAFSCSAQLSIKFFLLINVKMPTIIGILTFMSGKNSILGLSEPEKSQIS